ncbi:MAG: hypothetical protein ACFFEX_17700 [Candidatus Thorarchaeota archaeon]
MGNLPILPIMGAEWWGPKTRTKWVQDVTKRILSPVPCPVCGAVVDGVTVDVESIKNAERVPVIVPAKCGKGHAVVLFVDRNLTVRDVEAAAKAIQDEKDAVDKAQGWMDNF